MERLLQINVALLAVLGALMLGMGQRSLGLPLLMMAAAALSLWLTDIRGYLRLNRTLANLVALVVAVIVLTGELSHFAGQSQILGVAQLLVYLQIVLLFQHKRLREYWQIGMLSLLEVVAASAFMQGFWFGLALIAYMAAGLSALVLLCLFHQQRAALLAPRKSVSGSRRVTRDNRARAGRGKSSRRWPLANLAPGFRPVANGSDRAGLGRELAVRIAWLGLGTLALALVVFLTVPRFGETAWRGTSAVTQSLVGFSPEVTLGELGSAVEDPTEVLRARFFHHRSGQPYRVTSSIYLQGGLLTDYGDGRWRAGAVSPRVGLEPLDRGRRPLPDELVRQEFAIEPLRQRELFCVMPLIPLGSNFDVSVDDRRKRLLREEHLCGTRFRYELGTTAFVDGRQMPLVPAEGIRGRPTSLSLPDGSEGKSLPHLRELAARWIAESGIPPEDRYARAKYLEQRLAHSGEFTYMLEGVARDPTLDPIDDFLTNNRRGHCEYFATALTLMLRAVGIPARMVVGYKSDEYDRATDSFRVRQLHAHAWVEAFLTADQLPRQFIHGREFWGWWHGGWLRLEPTPAARDEMADLGGLHWSPWMRAKLWMDDKWSDFVLDMDRARQQEAIYAPLVRLVKSVWQHLGDPEWWRGWWEGIRGMAGWPRWQAGLLVSAVLLLLAGVGWLVYRVGRWLWRRLATLGRSARAGNRASPVAFQARLERLLARRGLHRRPGETARELAGRAAVVLAPFEGMIHGELKGDDVSPPHEQAAPLDVSGLPGEVVAAYYEVRFGGRPLDSSRSKRIEQTLRLLERIPRAT